RRGLRALSAPARAPHAARRDAFGRRAADARARPGADGQAAAADARRAEPGPGTAHRARDHAHRSRPAHDRRLDPARRAERARRAPGRRPWLRARDGRHRARRHLRRAERKPEGRRVVPRIGQTHERKEGSPRVTRRYSNPLLAEPARAMPRHVAIIGAGSIGPDIGYYLKSALPGLALTLVDLAQPALDAALGRFRSYADKAVARGKMKAHEAEAVLRDLNGTTDYDAIAPCDWVLEAATENLDLKRRIFADVEKRVADDAIITSNTSSLPAARIFAQL